MLLSSLAQGDFLVEQRNCVLIGGTGTGKTHLAIAIARSCIRAGKHGRFYNTVDLVNRLEAEARGGRQGRIAEYLTRRDFVVLDELGYIIVCCDGTWATLEERDGGLPCPTNVTKIYNAVPKKMDEIVWRFTKQGEFEFACLIPGHCECRYVWYRERKVIELSWQQREPFWNDSD